MFRRRLSLGFIILGGLLLMGCGADVNSSSGDADVYVVATTTIVGDVVSQVGGEVIALDVLLPVGADPHAFDPTPQDIAKVSEATVIFANGAGLEAFLEPLLENADDHADVVHLSDALDLRAFPMASEDDGDHNHEEDGDHDHEEDAGHAHTGADPHTWTDPNNVLVWVDVIEKTLSALDAANAEVYAANAEAYRAELQALDAWVREQVATVPPDNRKLVTDHAMFGYFAARYGFEQIGAVVPGYTTMAQPSARELAELEDHIRAYGVNAVFVGNTVNPDLTQRVAEDTGVRLVSLYTGSLTESDGEAGTYIAYVRHNVGEMVEALK